MKLKNLPITNYLWWMYEFSDSNHPGKASFEKAVYSLPYVSLAMIQFCKNCNDILPACHYYMYGMVIFRNSDDITS